MTRTVQDFYYLAGILRLSTKYFIEHLRTRAVKHLTKTWTYTLRGHDDMVDLAINSAIADDMTYPYVHPIHVINLARETNVRIVIPTAIYFLSLYPLNDILRADHPKLAVDHPSRPSSQLSTADTQAYTLMFQYRVDIILNFVRRTVGERHADKETCLNGQTACTLGFVKLASRLSRSWQTRTGPFHYMLQAIQELSDNGTVCLPCRKSFRGDVLRLRERSWEDLPGVVGCPSWNDLMAMDFPP